MRRVAFTRAGVPQQIGLFLRETLQSPELFLLGVNLALFVVGMFIETSASIIVLAPILLNSHPGTAYGVPFPVLLRASFGTFGANLPALMRALVACGWFGINAWIGGAVLLGILYAANGAGSALAALWIKRTGSPRRRLRAIWISWAGAGVAAAGVAAAARPRATGVRGALGETGEGPATAPPGAARPTTPTNR